MTEQRVELQEQITQYWDWRSDSGDLGTLDIRTDAEREVWLNSVRRLLPPAPVDAVDLGTGSGFLALLLAQLGHRATGIEISAGMLAQARANAAALSTSHRLKLEQGDAVDPPLEAASMDVITNRNVLWTLLEPEVAMQNWFKILRPGGRIVVLHGVPTPRDHNPAPDAQVSKNEKSYSAAVVEKLPPIRNQPTLDPVLPAVRAAGFTDIQIVRLEDIERFEREERDPPRDRIWLALTAKRP
jgi:SAM-dependent methyltransferase